LTRMTDFYDHGRDRADNPPLAPPGSNPAICLVFSAIKAHSHCVDLAEMATRCQRPAILLQICEIRWRRPWRCDRLIESWNVFRSRPRMYWRLGDFPAQVSAIGKVPFAAAGRRMACSPRASRADRSPSPGAFCVARIGRDRHANPKGAGKADPFGRDHRTERQQT